MVQPRLGPSATLEENLGLVQFLWCCFSVSILRLPTSDVMS